MIEFHTLEVENFLSIQTGTLDLKDRGLVLIEGVNLDDASAASNGAGKSSVVDAISWCLYGVTARGARGDSVVNIKSGKGTRVAVKVEIDGVSYLIERGRKHPKLKNRVKVYAWNVSTGEHTDEITQGTDDASQRMIDQMLGCNAGIFKASIYMGQEQMVDLPSLTDKDLKGLIEESLGLHIMDSAHAVAKNELAGLVDELQQLGREQDARDRNILALETDRDNVAEALETAVEEKTTLTTKMREAELELKTLQAAETKIAPMRAELEALKGKHKAELEIKIVEGREVHKKVEKLKSRLRDADRALMALQASKTHLQDQAGLIGSATDCPTCGATCLMDEEHIERLRAENQEKQDALQVQIDESQAEVNRFVGICERGARAVDKLQKQITDARLAGASEVTKLESKISHAAASTEGEINKQKNHVSFLREMVGNKVEAIERLAERHNKAVKGILFARVASDEAAIQYNKLTATIKSMENVTQALSRKGFRGEVLDQVTPYLNMRTQHYLAELTDGNITASWETIATNAAGDYVESFRIDVKHKSGVDSFKNLSGGEKRKVRLATSLALQDLVATRAVKPIKLFVADEIDDAIDESGLELLMGLLEQKGRDMGTVFVISHNDIKSLVSNTLTVTKHHAVSTF